MKIKRNLIIIFVVIMIFGAIIAYDKFLGFPVPFVTEMAVMGTLFLSTPLIVLAYWKMFLWFLKLVAIDITPKPKTVMAFVGTLILATTIAVPIALWPNPGNVFKVIAGCTISTLISHPIICFFIFGTVANKKRTIRKQTRQATLVKKGKYKECNEGDPIYYAIFECNEDEPRKLVFEFYYKKQHNALRENESGWLTYKTTTQVWGDTKNKFIRFEDFNYQPL